MAELIGNVVKYFKFEEIDIDNWVFKLYYQGSFVIFLLGSMIGVMSQYFGKPISCDFQGVDRSMAAEYCWIHGSSYIPRQYQKHMRCSIDMTGIHREEDAPDTSYYQWVTFVLLFQAGCFLIPSKLWKLMERGLMKSFGKEGKSAILLSSYERDCEGGVVMEKALHKYRVFFRARHRKNNAYFAKFVLCEFANLLVLLLTWYGTDIFLKFKFHSYGWNVVQWYREDIGNEIGHVRRGKNNPFCTVFPTEVSCTLPSIGAGGGGQLFNGLCVLSQNIINEKIFLVIWFWLVLLTLISIPHFVVRIMTLVCPWFRLFLLMSQAQVPADFVNEHLAKKSLTNILDNSYVGDWFVLHQLSKNVDSFFFRQLITEIELELLGTSATTAMPGRKTSYRPTSIHVEPPKENSMKRHSNLSSLSAAKNLPVIALRPNKSAISFAASSSSLSEGPGKIDEEEEIGSRTTHGSRTMDTLDV